VLFLHIVSSFYPVLLHLVVLFQPGTDVSDARDISPLTGLLMLDFSSSPFEEVCCIHALLSPSF